MNDKVSVLGIIFFLLCVALIGGVYYLNGQLVDLKGQYDELEQRKVELDESTKSLVRQKNVFTEAFKSLEQYHVNVASSDMVFYSDVQQKVQTSNINILSTRQGGVSRDGRSSLVLNLRGDYYSFTDVLAQWRNLPTTVRVSAMNVTASRTPETRGEVQVEVTVEAIVSNVGK